MLAFYRSQHDGYSWLASIAIVLDACTLLMAGIEGGHLLQAAATFAAARRVLDEMCHSLDVRSSPSSAGREPDPELFVELAPVLRSSMPDWRNDGSMLELVARLRRAYEPQLAGLSNYLLLPLPAWGRAPSADPAPFAKEQVIRQLTVRGADRR